MGRGLFWWEEEDDPGGGGGLGEGSLFPELDGGEGGGRIASKRFLSSK